MRCWLGHKRAHNLLTNYLDEPDVYDECVRCERRYKVIGPSRIELTLDKQEVKFKLIQLGVIKTPKLTAADIVAEVRERVKRGRRS